MLLVSLIYNTGSYSHNVLHKKNLDYRYVTSDFSCQSVYGVKSTILLFKLKWIRSINRDEIEKLKYRKTCTVFAITDWHVWLTVAYLHYQQIQSNTIIHLELCLCPVFTLFLLCFWSPPTPERNILVFSRWMLHYVDQLVSDCVCLPFDVEQVVFSRLSELFHEKQLPAAAKIDAVRFVSVNQNSEFVGGTTKRWDETRYKAL